MLRVLGIDFGTSTTYMQVKRYDGTEPQGDKFLYMPVVFNNGAAQGSVETVVQEYSDGSFRCGGDVDQEAEIEGAVIHREFKMDLENPDENKRKSAKRSTEQFFSYLYSKYNQQSSDYGNDDDEIETVISYPVKWKENTRRFMVEAAQKAGFKNVKGIDEARAAVFSVLCRQIETIRKEGILSEDNGYIMLIDMGAGTTDIVICRYDFANNSEATIDSLNIERIACWPIDSDAPTFGGREMDKMLAKYVEDYLKEALPAEMGAYALQLANTPGSAKAWKEQTVSAKLENNEDVTTCAYVRSIPAAMLKQKFPALDRSKFEALIANGLKSFAELIDGSINAAAEKDSDFARNGLDLVVLTGGHSAWYFAKEIIDGTMKGYVDSKMLSRIRENKNRVIRLTNPQATVSYGLVYSKLPFHIGTITNNASSITNTKDKDSTEDHHKSGKNDQLECKENKENDNQSDDVEFSAEKLYMMGKNCDKGSQKLLAKKCYEEAAKSGYPPALNALSYCYSMGSLYGLEQDKNKAEYYKQTAYKISTEKRAGKEQNLDRKELLLNEKCYSIAVEVTKNYNFEKYFKKEKERKNFYKKVSVLHNNPEIDMNAVVRSLDHIPYFGEICYATNYKPWQGHLIVSEKGIFVKGFYIDENADNEIKSKIQFISWQEFLSCQLVMSNGAYGIKQQAIMLPDGECLFLEDGLISSKSHLYNYYYLSDMNNALKTAFLNS